MKRAKFDQNWNCEYKSSWSEVKQN
jgi:hypothetical protein